MSRLGHSNTRTTVLTLPHPSGHGSRVVKAITAPELLTSEGAHAILPQAARTLPSGALLGSDHAHGRTPLRRMVDEVHLAVDARVQRGVPGPLARVRAESTGGPAAGPPTVALAPIAARSAPKAEPGKRTRRAAEELARVANQL